MSKYRIVDLEQHGFDDYEVDSDSELIEYANSFSGEYFQVNAKTLNQAIQFLSDNNFKVYRTGGN